jgi:hypothetical protein
LRRATRSSKQRITHIVCNSAVAASPSSSDTDAPGPVDRPTGDAYAATGAVPRTSRTAPAIFAASGSTNASIGWL